MLLRKFKQGKSGRRFIAVFALTLSALLVSSGPTWAAPGGVGTGYIGQSTQLTVSTGWTNWGTYKTIGVTANMSNLAADSVYLSSIQICHGGPAGQAIYISPWISNGTVASTWDSGAAYQVYGGTCRTWNVDRTWYRQSSGEMFRVTARITDGAQKLTTVSGFYR